MECNFFSLGNLVNSSQNSTQTGCVSSPRFCGKAQEKLIKKIMSSKNPKEWKFTFDELTSIYEHLGFDIVLKRGSHATVNIRGTNIPIVIPHKDKYVHPNDIRRLKLVMAGEEKRAQLI